MSKLYQFFNRFGFILAILAALAMPIFVLCTTASAAETDMYSYNGVVLPDINTVWIDKETYPYAYIYRAVTNEYFPVAGLQYTVLRVTSFPLSHDELLDQFHLHSIDDNKYKQYIIAQDIETANALTSSVGWECGVSEWAFRTEAALSNGSMYTTNNDDFIWSSHDVHCCKNVPGGISFEDTIYVSGSEPVPVGGSSLEFEVSASWEDVTYRYDVGETADVFSVSTVLGIEYDISYQWFEKEYGASEWTVLNGETFPTFVPQTDDENVGASVYYCSVTASDGTQSVTVDSPFLYVTVYEVPEYTEPTVDETDEKLDGIQDSLDDVQNSIDEIISGSDEQQSAAEDFKNQVDENTQKMDEAIEALDQISMPDIDSINIGIIDMIDASGFLAINAILGVLWDNNVIMTVMTFAFVLAMVAFFIFGKKG